MNVVKKHAVFFLLEYHEIKTKIPLKLLLKFTQSTNIPKWNVLLIEAQKIKIDPFEMSSLLIECHEKNIWIFYRMSWSPNEISWNSRWYDVPSWSTEFAVLRGLGQEPQVCVESSGVCTGPEPLGELFYHWWLWCCILYGSIWWFPTMGYSTQWMVYNGESCWNGWVGGTPISGNLHMYIYIYTHGVKSPWLGWYICYRQYTV